MQAIGRQPQRAPDGTPVHYERDRPEQTTLYRLVQQQTATFFAQAEDAAGSGRPQFAVEEFKAPRALCSAPVLPCAGGAPGREKGV